MGVNCPDSNLVDPGEINISLLAAVRLLLFDSGSTGIMLQTNII